MTEILFPLLTTKMHPLLESQQLLFASHAVVGWRRGVAEQKKKHGEHRETGQGGMLLVNAVGSEISKLMESATVCDDFRCQGIDSASQQQSGAQLWLLDCFLEAAYPRELVSGKPCRQMGGLL